MRLVFVSAFFGVMSLAATAAASSSSAASSYAALRDGDIIHGFRATAVYLNDADHAMGARFRHQRTGFTLDLLEIQSVPQAFTWVTTFPTSDMGEPHTQEHLLLGKGNKGRARSNAEPMRLVNSSAFTMQWRTCYHFHTTAGTDAFFEELEQSLDALLHPDYTDEEIRREVRNFGVSHLPDQSLQLEEKGTVYNEMVTSMDLPAWRLWRATGRAIYGREHPLAFNSGGEPEALRRLQPEDIRRFHAATHFLGNMGSIIALARDTPPANTLARLDAIFARLEPEAVKQRVITEADLPPATPAPAGQIAFVSYPFRDAQKPSDVNLVWPADRTLDMTERILCELFLENFASDPTSNLYKRFIDSRTREYELGAQSVGADVSEEVGAPIVITFGDLPAARATEAELADLRRRVRDELGRIAAWSDGSPELAEFNSRLHNRLIARRRAAAKFINSPPGFGFRGTRSIWLQRLHELNRTPAAGFEKSITQKPELAAIEQLISSPNRNLWRERLAAWRLLDIEPQILAARPDPELLRQEQVARGRRVAAELARLGREYQLGDVQAALQRYQEVYDAKSAELEAADRSIPPPKFVANPPLTLDDQIEFKMTKLAGDVPLVASTFDSMTSAYTGIVLRLESVPEEQLVWLSMLPDLLTGVGVIEHGRPVSFEEMSERLRREILSLEARFRTDVRTGHVELVVRGGGNDVEEARRALAWIRLVLWHPDWRPENLSRIRDLADQVYVGLRNTMQDREERWVNDPAAAYRKQESPIFLSAGSFLTRTHHVFRLRWMLKDPGLTVQDRATVAEIFQNLTAVTGAREEIKARLTAFAAKEYLPAIGKIVRDVGRDLEQVLADIPDASLAADWKYLCDRMRRDFEIGPARTLRALDGLRRSLLKTGGARLFAIGSTPTHAALAQDVAALAGALEATAFVPASYRAGWRVDGRLREREPGADAPRFVGLLNPNSQAGVFLNSARGTSYLDTSRDARLDYLASNLYGGGGAHGVFMKTWAAGLAYSNGIRISLGSGLTAYYAERTPELPQTLKFVIDYLSTREPDPSLVEFAIAAAFNGSRAAGTYESRGEAVSHDLMDGLPPEAIATFRRGILELRSSPNLGDELFARANKVYARVLPGMASDSEPAADAVYFVIGPEKQFGAYETYLRTAVGADAKIHRLHPRDFWLVEE